MKQGVRVVIEDAKALAGIQEKEKDLMKEQIELILKAGANVVLTTKGIDDMALKYFVEAGVIAVRRVLKSDLRRIAKATGATLLLTLADLEGNLAFDSSMLGTADQVSQERFSDEELIIIRGTKFSKSSSVILRGPSPLMLDEMERAFHDCLCVVKRTLESNQVVPGGGATEAALSIYLENFATTLGSREQLAIVQFAEAMLVIPKTLAQNAALDCIDMIAKLQAHHAASQNDPSKKHFAQYGLDLQGGTIRDNVKAGVLEPAMIKIKAIQFATEAAISILRIDDVIKLDPKQEPEDHHDH